METFNTIVNVLANPMVGWAITALFGVLSVFIGAKLAKVTTLAKELRDVAAAYQELRDDKKRSLSNGHLDEQEQAELDADLDKVQKELVESAIAVAAFFKK